MMFKFGPQAKGWLWASDELTLWFLHSPALSCNVVGIFWSSNGSFLLTCKRLVWWFIWQSVPVRWRWWYGLNNTSACSIYGVPYNLIRKGWTSPPAIMSLGELRVCEMWQDRRDISVSLLLLVGGRERSKESHFQVSVSCKCAANLRSLAPIALSWHFRSNRWQTIS